VTLAEDVTGPYDVIVRAEAAQRRRARQARRREGPERGRDHPHADLPGGPPLILPARRVRAVGAAVALAAGIGLVGCGRAVQVTPPQPPSEVRAVCERLAARLPDRIDSERRRKVTPDDPLTASWGDPPMVLRCGVGAPALESPPAPAPQVEGVTWSARKLRDGYLFTTSGRRVFVEMLVRARTPPR
jgi:hypothetical protein